MNNVDKNLIEDLTPNTKIEIDSLLENLLPQSDNPKTKPDPNSITQRIRTEKLNQLIELSKNL